MLRRGPPLVSRFLMVRAGRAGLVLVLSDRSGLVRAVRVVWRRRTLSVAHGVVVHKVHAVIGRNLPGGLLGWTFSLSPFA